MEESESRLWTKQTGVSDPKKKKKYVGLQEREVRFWEILALRFTPDRFLVVVDNGGPRTIFTFYNSGRSYGCSDVK